MTTCAQCGKHGIDTSHKCPRTVNLEPDRYISLTVSGMRHYKLRALPDGTLIIEGDNWDTIEVTPAAPNAVEIKSH